MQGVFSNFKENIKLFCIKVNQANKNVPGLDIHIGTNRFTKSTKVSYYKL